VSTKPNHRRGEPRRQDHGPTWEGKEPDGDAPHVARARRGWKRTAARSERRTGQRSPKVWPVHLRGKPRPRPEE